jgi:hypothetical protein
MEATYENTLQLVIEVLEKHTRFAMEDLTEIHPPGEEILIPEWERGRVYGFSKGYEMGRLLVITELNGIISTEKMKMQVINK